MQIITYRHLLIKLNFLLQTVNHCWIMSFILSLGNEGMAAEQVLQKMGNCLIFNLNNKYLKIILSWTFGYLFYLLVIEPQPRFKSSLLNTPEYFIYLCFACFLITFPASA